MMHYVEELKSWRTESGELVPMPETASPGFERHRGWITVHRDKHALKYFQRVNDPYEAREFVAGTDEIEIRTDILERKRYCAHAPFVGDPQWQLAMYFWDAFVGLGEQYLALEAQLEWRAFG